MTKQEAIMKSLYIQRMGEKQYFQITIPRDAKRIVGFEYGASEKFGVLLPPPGGGVLTPLTILPNKVMGKLVLRAAGCEGFFYQGDLKEDSNIHFGEVIAPVQWQPKPWTHGKKRDEVEFSVTENSMVCGFFQDSWGFGEYESLTYKLNLYLWIEKCAA